jgi:proteasome component ECM29
LSEVIVGREWSDLGGGGAVLNDDDLLEGGDVSAGVRLLRIWNAAARALDDVQGAVRDSGEALARAARALTIRLCSSTSQQQNRPTENIYQQGITTEIDAAAAAGTSIWWLMRKGLNHTCPEVTGASMSTLVEIIGVVRPGILEPSLPTLLTSLLLAVSALEPSALNYMQLRTSDHDGLERARLQLAQTGPLAVALAKCLEVVPRSKLETQQAIAPALDSALRQSAGFATRAATADAVSTLCTTCPAVFHFAGSSISNPSVRLLRAFYFASERERGTAAKDKMIHALGNLAAICPAASVRSLAVRACVRYRQSTGNNFDPSSRRAAAAALRTIAVRASNVFSDGGRGDVWCNRVLPVAYIGRKDADTKIASMWQDVWDEGGSVANVSDSSSPTRNYGTRLEEKLLQSLVQECVSALQDVSWSSRVAGASALQDLCSIGVLSPVAHISQSLPETAGFSLLRAKNRACASQVAITQCIRVLVKPRLWDGKSELLKAVALLTSKWLVATVSDDGESYGEDTIDDFLASLPWWPVVISRKGNETDLCVNDGWFTQNNISDGPDKVEPSDNAKDVIVSYEVRVNNERSINFQQCDELLGADEVEEFASETDTKHEKIDMGSVVTLKGLSRFLIEQAIPPPTSQRSTIDADVLLVYRTTAFSCFKNIMDAIPKSYKSTRTDLYRIFSLSLLSMISHPASDKDVEQRSPPVLISGSINCIESLLWEGIGISNTNDCDVSNLIATMKEVGGAKQPAWTVRAAAAQCIGHIIRLCDDETIQHYMVVSNVVDTARQALTDRRFWKVR